VCFLGQSRRSVAGPLQLLEKCLWCAGFRFRRKIGILFFPSPSLPGPLTARPVKLRSGRRGARRIFFARRVPPSSSPSLFRDSPFRPLYSPPFPPRPSILPIVFDPEIDFFRRSRVSHLSALLIAGLHTFLFSLLFVVQSER